MGPPWAVSTVPGGERLASRFPLLRYGYLNFFPSLGSTAYTCQLNSVYAAEGVRLNLSYCVLPDL
jgi:hypothetical protein